jgi:protein TonB
MFEDSLFASRVGVASATKRWTLAASVALQMALAAVVITLPLLHPEALPMRGTDAPKVLMPQMPKPPVPVVVTERQMSDAATDAALSSETRQLIFSSRPGVERATNDRPPLLPYGRGMSEGAGLPPGIAMGDGHGPGVSVAPIKQAGPVHISTLSEGMLLAPIRPVYPPIARTAGVQGTVVVEAVISRTGSIESLRVVSGPLMLQNSALEAIRAAKYKPYKLNGEPVEVQTTVTVNFRING